MPTRASEAKGRPTAKNSGRVCHPQATHKRRHDEFPLYLLYARAAIVSGFKPAEMADRGRSRQHKAWRSLCAFMGGG